VEILPELRLHFWTPTSGTPVLLDITEKPLSLLHTQTARGGFSAVRLDCLSCVLTIASTILVGRRCREGWILAAINSAVVCVIGFRTSQFGFIPANVLCIALYVVNLRNSSRIETGAKRLCTNPSVIPAVR
jgi:nicotinamide riboside transporter PnuC